MFTFVFVVLHVSAPYNRTALTFQLKILNFVFPPISFDFQMLFNWIKAAQALPILALMSASDSPNLSTILPKYINDSTS